MSNGVKNWSILIPISFVLETIVLIVVKLQNTGWSGLDNSSCKCTVDCERKNCLDYFVIKMEF